MSTVKGNFRQARGYHGEQAMGWVLGERGYFFVDGPGGAAGHQVWERGFDGVAYNPKLDHLIIYDNKSFVAVEAVRSDKAAAIDPAKRLLQNLDDLDHCVEALEELPNKARISELITKTREAVRSGRPWPSNVKIAISNAGGRSTGVGGRLAEAGIQFLNYYEAPKPPPVCERVQARLARLAGPGRIIGKVVRGRVLRVLAAVSLPGSWEVLFLIDTLLEIAKANRYPLTVLGHKAYAYGVTAWAFTDTLPPAPQCDLVRLRAWKGESSAHTAEAEWVKQRDEAITAMLRRCAALEIPASEFKQVLRLQFADDPRLLARTVFVGFEAGMTEFELEVHHTLSCDYPY